MKLAVALTLVAILAPGLARADEWWEAQAQELEQGDLERALELYAAVQRSGSPRAAEATRRRLLILAGRGDEKAALGELALLKTWPEPLPPELRDLEGDPRAWIAGQAAARKGKPEALAKPFTASFEGATLEEVLDFVRDVSGLNVVSLGLPPGAKVTLLRRETPLRDVLTAALAAAGCAWTLRDQAVVVHPAGKAPAFPAFTGGDLAREPELYELLGRRRLTRLQFQATSLAEVVHFLRDVTGMCMVLLPDVPTGAAVTCRLQDIPLREALRLILAQSELSMSLLPGALVIGRRPLSPALAAPAGEGFLGVVSLKLESAPLAQVRTRLEELSERKVDLGGLDPARQLTLDLRGVPLWTALELVAASLDASWRAEGGRIVFAKGR